MKFGLRYLNNYDFDFRPWLIIKIITCKVQETPLFFQNAGQEEDYFIGFLILQISWRNINAMIYWLHSKKVILLRQHGPKIL